MKDYLLKIGTTKLKYILRGGYEIQEDQEIVLAKITTADGTERRNIASSWTWKFATMNLTASR